MRDTAVLIRLKFTMEKHLALNIKVDGAIYYRSLTDGYVWLALSLRLRLLRYKPDDMTPIDLEFVGVLFNGRFIFKSDPKAVW